MLDSRYVHLHEALGLGEMWLKQNTHVRLRPTVPTPITPTTAPPPRPKERLSSAQRQAWREHTSVAATTTAPTTVMTPPKPAPQPLFTHTSPTSPKKIMAIVMAPSMEDLSNDQLLSGEDGLLFDKMLQAIELQRQDVHLSPWLTQSLDFEQPNDDTISQALPRLRQEYQHSQAQALLLVGRFFERPQIKAHAHQLAKTDAVFLIPHPQQIMANPQLKRPAWDSLQRLKRHLNTP